MNLLELIQKEYGHRPFTTCNEKEKTTFTQEDYDKSREVGSERFEMKQTYGLTSTKIKTLAES